MFIHNCIWSESDNVWPHRQEYNAQMVRYYGGGLSVVAVLPRKIRDMDCSLVCLRHEKEDQNTLCQVGRGGRLAPI